MHRFLIKRILSLIPIVFGVILIVFTIMAFTPGNPGRTILGPTAPKEAVEQLNLELGYNKSFLLRLGDYLINALQGDFGTSWINSKPVFGEILKRAPTTFKLAFMGVAISVLIGVPIGIISAIKQYSAIDFSSVVTAMLLSSIPEFWLGLMMIILFSLKLRWFPPHGIGSLKHFILPSITLAVSTLALMIRLTRTTMLETIRQDYIRTARSKGAPESTVIIKHALRNALLPIITVIGNVFGTLLGGTIIIESVFSIPGIGSLLLSSILMKDIPQVMATVIFLAAIFSFIMVAVDIAHALVDPRIKARYIN